MSQTNGTGNEEIREPAVEERVSSRHRKDVFRCAFCRNESFRRSRPRAEDFFAILRLRYPIRCLRCNRRQLASFSLAGIAVPSSERHHRVQTEAESWKSWTAGDSGKSLEPNAPSPAAPAYRGIGETTSRPQRQPSTRDRSDDIW